MSAYTVRVSKTKTVQVDSLLAAGRAVRDEIQGPLGWMGSTEWYGSIARNGNGACVRDAKNKTVAHVSYNGRIWSLDGSEVTT